MSRRFTFFFTMLLLPLLALTAKAEDGILSLKSVAEDYVTTGFEAGKYYLIQVHGQANQVHYMYPNAEGTSIKGTSPHGEGPAATKFLWFITPTENENEYNFQSVTTGRYLSIDGTSNNGAVTLKEAPAPIIIDVDGTSVALKNSSDQYIDMGYSGEGVCTWAGGVSGSRRMEIFVCEVEYLSNKAILMSELNDLMSLYDVYVPGIGEETLDIGTGIGQYNAPEDVVTTFLNSIKQAWDLLISQDANNISEEELAALVETIKTSYATIVASKVPLAIADGNYRIVSAMQWTKTIRKPTGEEDADGNPIYEEEVTHPLKAMYATMNHEGKWGTLDETDCRYLWRIEGYTPSESGLNGQADLINLATDEKVKECKQSTNAVMAAEVANKVQIDYVMRREDGKIVIAIKSLHSGNNGYSYLHAGGHGGGAGEGSNLVGWNYSTTELGATTWYLEPVDDETTQKLIDEFAPLKNHELLVKNWQALIAQGEEAIAAAKNEVYSFSLAGDGLFTDPSQFSSPFTTTDLQQKDGAAATIEDTYGFLLNSSTTQYWHSRWEDNAQPAHSHYFQLALEEPINAEYLRVWILRRSDAVNDHITKMSVYTAEDAAALEERSEEGWTKIADVETPWNTTGEVTSNSFGPVAGVQYLRFYIDDTYGSQISATRGYGHMAGFQIYPVTKDGNTQWSQLGDKATAFTQTLADAKAMDPDELGIEEYNDLKAAVDAFKALIIDVAPLAAAIDANKGIVDNIVIGENPGYWSSESSAGSFKAVIEEANAYIKSGAYTQAETDKYVAAIQQGVSNIMASANPVEPGKWYRIYFDSEDNYDAHKWDKHNVVNTTLGDLYNTILSPAAQVTADGSSHLEAPSSLEEVEMGHALRFINEDDVQTIDEVAFRFVEVGDSAYVLQHKSGLFVNGAARGNSLSLSLTPALYDVKAAGLGKVLIHARDLHGAEFGTSGPVYLHAQNAGHSLVTWTANEVSSNSALLIEAIDENDLDGTDVAESIQLPVHPNSMLFWCYASGYSVSSGTLFEYIGANEQETEWTFCFNQIEEAAPGQPVLYVNGDTKQFSAEAEKETEHLSVKATSFAAEPDTIGGIHGTYGYQWVDEGTIVVYGGGIGTWGNILDGAEGEDWTDCTRDVFANTGYIVIRENIIDEEKAGTADFTISVKKDRILGVQDVISLVKQAGNLYTIDGKLLKKNATMSDIKAMGKGLYILNGAKISVK